MSQQQQQKKSKNVFGSQETFLSSLQLWMITKKSSRPSRERLEVKTRPILDLRRIFLTPIFLSFFSEAKCVIYVNVKTL
jgi:hypothetical protein